MSADWLRRTTKYSLIDVLVWFPTALASGPLVLRGTSLWLWVVSLVVLRLLMIPVRGWTARRGWLIVMGAILSLADAWLFVGWHALTMVFFATAFAWVWRTVQIGRPDMVEYPAPFFVFGVLLNIAFEVLAHNVSMYHAYLPELTVFGVLGLAVSIFELNWATLGNVSFAASDRPDVDRSVIRRNRTYSVLLLLIVVAVAAIRPLQHWVESWFSRSGSGGTPGTPGTHTTPPPPSSAPPNLPKPVPPSHLGIVLSHIFEVMGILILIAVGVWFVLQFWKIVQNGMDTFLTWLRDMLGREVETPAYTETQERLRASESRRPRRLGWRRSASEPAWEMLSAGERVRRLYRRILAGAITAGFPWSDADTPSTALGRLRRWWNERMVEMADASGRSGGSRATGTDDASVMELERLYNEVRYGDCVPDPADVDRLRERLENETGPGQHLAGRR